MKIFILFFFFPLYISTQTSDSKTKNLDQIVENALDKSILCLTLELKKHYLNEAERILKSLCLPPYFSEGKGTNCLILHSTQYYRLTDNTDVPSTFADYYFMESMLRYKLLNKK